MKDRTSSGKTRACQCIPCLRDLQAEIMKRGRDRSTNGGLGYLWDAEEERDLLEQAIKRIKDARRRRT